MKLYDAHNHLQDVRLGEDHAGMWGALRRENVALMVVNGTTEEDWPRVMELARSNPEVLPSFGYHPWWVRERSSNWEARLADCLDAVPSAVGEIGLDGWVKGHDLEDQERVFRTQLGMAAERNVPASIHCIQAWGRLVKCLDAGPRPACGFLLHSFGGPPEMIPDLAAMGAYFSFPGYYAHDRKIRQREGFLQVPPDRLLIETDAPDQSMPAERVTYPLPQTSDGKPVNHPANLGAVYQFVAEFLGCPAPELAGRVEANFKRLFGGIPRSAG